MKHSVEYAKVVDACANLLTFVTIFYPKKTLTRLVQMPVQIPEESKLMGQSITCQMKMMVAIDLYSVVCRSPPNQK